MTILKDYQERVVGDIEKFFLNLDLTRQTYQKISELHPALSNYLALFYANQYGHFLDRPVTGAGKPYPRGCIKMPTAGGKTLVAVETIRLFQNLFAKRKTGLVVWITHREQIYRQTIEHLHDKRHIYRELLDQASGNRTLILEKGQPMRLQDTEEYLVVLMLMIQSARRDTNKIFADSGYTDFFPPEHQYHEQQKLLAHIPNLDHTAPTPFGQAQIKTSLGNVIRTLEPLVLVDEFHTMFTDIARATLDGLNPAAVIGLSATPPKQGMNIIAGASGRELKAAGMVKLDMHIIPPRDPGKWQSMVAALKAKRETLERAARAYGRNSGIYIRPIALIQVERTGKDQRKPEYVHSEDVREFLIAEGVPAHEIAVKSSERDDIKGENLLSKNSEVRYIITKEALKEGWDCSFAYLLGVIPNAQSNTSMTQLVGRILRQPYAKKTGIAALDESYIFFSNGQTEDVLTHVKMGFEEEGLGDIGASGIAIHNADGALENPRETVRIKKEIARSHPESLFLPVWLIRAGRGYRKFSYETDIAARIPWGAFDLQPFVEEIAPTIGARRNVQQDILIGLEGATELRETEIADVIAFDTLYLARRLFETTGNGFIAHSMAERIAAELVKRVPQHLLDQDAGYIAAECEKRLAAFKRGEERRIFEQLLTSHELVLAVSDDERLGFEMPRKDTVSAGVHAAYRFNLYDAFDAGSLNSLERNLARVIEGSEHVLWWARNKAERGWYAVQGWQRNKIRPDFVIAKKNYEGGLEFVYVVESKGEQLAGNADTQYKDAVFQKMNSAAGPVAQIRIKVTTAKLNERFEFELIPQGEEERRLRMKLDASAQENS